MAAGFIYVLVNSSMPGLIKVGKTTRTPSDRAEELSGVSGVPTAFIVAYEEHFTDCDAAELFVHTKLAEMGMRLSTSREFFRAPVSDVVKVLASIPATLRSEAVSEENLHSDSNQESIPWKSILDEADRHRYGLGDYIQDPSEAMRLYRDASRLGSAIAFENLGEMHWLKRDAQRALEFYKEGAKRGNYYCYLKMAVVFDDQNHDENFRKAFSKFISEGESNCWNSERRFGIQRHLYEMCFFLKGLCWKDGFSGFNAYLAPTLRKYGPQLVEEFNRELTQAQSSITRDVAGMAIRHLQALGVQIETTNAPTPSECSLVEPQEHATRSASPGQSFLRDLRAKWSVLTKTCS